MPTQLTTAEQAHRLIHERMGSDDWWVVIDPTQVGLGRLIERTFYSTAETSPLCEVFAGPVPPFPMIGVATFHKDAMSRRQLEELVDSYTASGYHIDEGVDVLLPAADPEAANLAVYVAAFYAQSEYPAVWPPPDGPWEVPT